MLTHSYLALHQPGPPVGYCTSHDGDFIWSCSRIETPESLCSVRGPAGHKRVSDFTSRYGQWALVAGASEGLGAAFAEQLAERGMNVLLVARREPELAELARRLGAGARREHAVCEIQPGLLVYNAALIAFKRNPERPLRESGRGAVVLGFVEQRAITGGNRRVLCSGFWPGVAAWVVLSGQAAAARRSITWGGARTRKCSTGAPTRRCTFTWLAPRCCS